MLKTLTLDEAQQFQSGGMIVKEEGEFFRFVSTDIEGVKPSDHVDILLPRMLPIDQNGNVITVGIFNNAYSYELDHDLAGAEAIVYTGKFIRATSENKHSVFECRHPKYSEDVMVDALKECDNHYYSQDIDEPNEEFGIKYGDAWNCRYSSFSDSGHWVKDVWILPIDGPIQPVCRYLSVLTDHSIDEGDIAFRLRAEDEREYQANKAMYRADLERSGLIGRFRRACAGIADATLELKDDYVELISPDGEVSHIRYDHNCLTIVWRIVRIVEEALAPIAPDRRFHPTSFSNIIMNGLPS